MMMHVRENKYVVVSPVKDEEIYIEQTIKSILSQTIRPVKWFIVDDGSKDRTPDIIEKYCKQHSWIELIRMETHFPRQPGSAVIRAFNQGYMLARKDQFDYIVKLDCDLKFEPDYFEELFSRFDVDDKLGIASGIYLEKNGDSWNQIKMPYYHAAGASKVVRAECFSQIGGFVSSRGWDTVDEIRAQMMGWKTIHFKDIKMYHLKTEGSGIGHLRTNAMHGEVFYLTGGYKQYFVMKVIHRMILGKPFIVGGLMMLYGFLRPLILKRRRLVSEDEARFYKKLLNKRISGMFNNIFRK